MTAILELARTGPSGTDGEIAAINLKRARRNLWVLFAQDPSRQGAAFDAPVQGIHGPSADDQRFVG